MTRRKYRDPMAFLKAVALGQEPGATISQRIRAAGILSRKAAASAPLRPRDRARIEAQAAESAVVEDFQKRADEIRKRHGR